MPETNQSNRAIAVEAVTDLARNFARRAAVTVVLLLAAFQVLGWFPGLTDSWRYGLAFTGALIGAGLVVLAWDRRRA